jgi:hypothetical protein
MSGPESVYSAMTSGNVGAVRGLEGDVSSAMGNVRDNIELIRYAADKPDWSSPSARTRFNMSAWTTRASAEISYIRLNRAKLSLQQAATGYSEMHDAASTVIEHWRSEKKLITDALSLLLLRAVTLVQLYAIRGDFGQVLDDALDFVQADPLTDAQEDWLENGLARSMRRDLEHPSYPGPIIPGTLATGDDDGGWTPQGLGYDPASGYLLQTSYNHDGQAQLSLVDPETGELVRNVDLGADQHGDFPNHAGGVAVHDGTLFVSSSDTPPRIFQYSMADITGGHTGATVPVQGLPQPVSGGAYSTVVGDTLYAGTFDKDGPGKLYTYTWDQQTGSWGAEKGPFETPPQTQGIAVRDNEVVFSTSWGRDSGGKLESYNLNDVLSSGGLGSPLQTVDLPNMAEGVAALPSGLVTTHESGSSNYVDPDGNPLESLWASMNMTVTPYADLGLAGMVIDVEPLTLREASTHFDEVENGLHDAEKDIARLTLPSGCLGDVPQAAGFAAALTKHFDTTATWLTQGKLSAGVTSSGLITTAAGYEDTDSHSGGLFHQLQGLLS